jgi:hypothetical protein
MTTRYAPNPKASMAPVRIGTPGGAHAAFMQVTPPQNVLPHQIKDSEMMIPVSAIVERALVECSRSGQPKGHGPEPGAGPGPVPPDIRQRQKGGDTVSVNARKALRKLFNAHYPRVVGAVFLNHGTGLPPVVSMVQVAGTRIMRVEQLSQGFSSVHRHRVATLLPLTDVRRHRSRACAWLWAVAFWLP